MAGYHMLCNYVDFIIILYYMLCYLILSKQKNPPAKTGGLVSDGLFVANNRLTLSVSLRLCRLINQQAKFAVGHTHHTGS
ncbi:hypothetical protein, partial [Bacillus pumilus]|uniref:hypothetical protein n=1 Tax=Bacillus pumilus TaxID=1408 RepID=UPI00196AD07F